MLEKEQVIKWLESHRIQNFVIREDLTVDINGHVDISGRKITEKLPVRFGEVTGSFKCFNNLLETLENCPTNVGGDFDCSSNNLKNLLYSPSFIGGSYNCSKNKITSLANCSFKVNKNFDCSYNNIHSLEDFNADINNLFIHIVRHSSVRISELTKQYKLVGRMYNENYSLIKDAKVINSIVCENKLSRELSSKSTIDKKFKL